MGCLESPAACASSAITTVAKARWQISLVLFGALLGEMRTFSRLWRTAPDNSASGATARDLSHSSGPILWTERCVTFSALGAYTCLATEVAKTSLFERVSVGVLDGPHNPDPRFITRTRVALDAEIVPEAH